MAIALVGSATNTGDATTSLAITISGISISNGQCMLAFISTRPNSSTLTPPAGWALMGVETSGTPGIRLATYFRIANSEPSSYTWNFSSANDAAGGIIVYSGTDPVYPIDVSNISNGLDASAEAPSVTTSVADGHLVCIFVSSSGVAITHPSGMTERWDIGTGIDDHQNECADLTLGAVGATGTKTATVADDRWMARSIALRPPAGPILSHFGSFNTGTGAATTTVAVTSVGFQPKAIIFFFGGRTESTDTIGRARHDRGFGFATSATNRRAVHSNSVDAGASSDAGRYQTDVACIAVSSTGGGCQRTFRPAIYGRRWLHAGCR